MSHPPPPEQATIVFANAPSWVSRGRPFASRRPTKPPRIPSTLSDPPLRVGREAVQPSRTDVEGRSVSVSTVAEGLSVAVQDDFFTAECLEGAAPNGRDLPDMPPYPVVTAPTRLRATHRGGRGKVDALRRGCGGRSSTVASVRGTLRRDRLLQSASRIQSQEPPRARFFSEMMCFCFRRRSLSPRLGRVALRFFGTKSARPMSSASLFRASSRLRA